MFTTITVYNLRCAVEDSMKMANVKITTRMDAMIIDENGWVADRARREHVDFISTGLLLSIMFPANPNKATTG